MKIIKMKNLEGGERDVHCPSGGFRSLRALLASDGMGFSLHKTIVPSGKGPQHWHYKNHLEACYCIAGLGRITNKATGETFWVNPDTIYVLDKNDDHTFEAIEDVILISIFNPPVTGREVHNEDGSYSLVKA